MSAYSRHMLFLTLNSVAAGVNAGLYAWTDNPLNLGAAVFVAVIAIYFALEASRA